MKQIIAILMILNLSFVLGQEKELKRANSEFEDYAYVDAIANYERLVEEGYSDENIFKQLGNANYANARYGSAAEWYGKLVKLENADVDVDYYYRYAQSLKSLGDYKGSDYWMEKFEAKKGGDQRVKNFVEKEDYLDRIKKNSGRYDIKSLDINSQVSDFAPSFHGDELVFSTARDTGIVSRRIHEWNNGAFLNLYKASLSEDQQLGDPKRLSKKLNTRTHESSSVFTKDGNMMYFTRNNSENRKFARDSEGVSRLKLYVSTFRDGEWQQAVELPFNSDEYSVAHPALSEDDRTLYFSSDMPGTLGASDIFKVAVNEDGSFGTIANLGNTVNTEARESFPFIADNVLYFSSDGHPGLGGLDVFGTSLDGENNPILNLGEPLNSKQDDFSYIINSESKGYFASNREGGKGDDDIYGFTETEPLIFDCISNIAGVVRNINNGDPVAGASVQIMDANGKVISTTTSDENGSFATSFKCGGEDLSAVGMKDEFKEGKASFQLNEVMANNSVELLLTPIEVVAKKGTNLKMLNIPPIYFDLNKSNIRPDAALELQKVIDYMNRFPVVNIAIGSHTDSRDTKAYNERLSERRAKATLEYMVKTVLIAIDLQLKVMVKVNWSTVVPTAYVVQKLSIKRTVGRSLS